MEKELSGKLIGICTWCKSTKLKIENTYFDIDLNEEVTKDVIVCESCGCTHFEDGSFQIDVIPKECSTNVGEYVGN